MTEHKFKRLKVWHKAMSFIEDIYKITKQFPKVEAYGLVSQLRRATTSIAMNIAEGSIGTQPEFKQFLNVSLRSSYEVICGLEIARRLGYCNDKQNMYLLNKCNELAAMIYSLKRRLKEDQQ